MSQTLKLRDEVYEALLEAARESGMAPEEWIAAKLPATDSENGAGTTAKAIERANARLRRTIASSGQQGPCDNEQIDKDLAREYGADLIKRPGQDKR
jgi:hypothetical protein